MFSIAATSYFLRRARKFLKRHPDLEHRFAEVVDALKRDPFQPSLEYHHLSGKLKGLQAVSLNASYRITLTVVVTEKEVVLIDIGSHDEVYR